MPFRLKDNVSVSIKQGSGKPFQMVIPTAILAIERVFCANFPLAIKTFSSDSHDGAGGVAEPLLCTTLFSFLIFPVQFPNRSSRSY